MKRPQNLIFVIFGASGDLTRIKLIPALYKLFRQSLLPERFAVLGIGRTPLSSESFRKKIDRDLSEGQQVAEKCNESQTNFCQNLYYQSIETQEPSNYNIIKGHLKKLSTQLEISPNFLFYLATPPELYQVITTGLAQCGLNKQDEGWRRIIIEKPFGTDLDSALALNTSLLEIFKEDQLYRIDHYLGKETVQNILVTRFANSFFEPIWNHRYIDYIEITSAEDIGIKERGGYFDNAGTLRDMIQNHLLQLIGIIAMEPPALFNANAIRNETVKVLHSLRPISETEVDQFVIRGQYTEPKDKKTLSYTEEKGVRPDSRTETFVALKVFIDNWRWSGVPFYVRSGKRLKSRVTEIVINLKAAPHQLFKERALSRGGNQIIIRIQPDEGIALDFGMKIPGAGFKVQDANLHFHYKDLASKPIPEAYERLLLDCMQGDPTLFARADAVEASWKFIMPILNAWKTNKQLPLYKYPNGSWGPKEACQLFNDSRCQWRHPCASFSLDGICDL